MPDAPGDAAAELRAANARLRELLAGRDAEVAGLRALVAGLQVQVADLAARLGQNPGELLQAAVLRWAGQAGAEVAAGQERAEAGRRPAPDPGVLLAQLRSPDEQSRPAGARMVEVARAGQEPGLHGRRRVV